MLQVTRRSYQPSSKMRSSQKRNFIARNKQSVAVQAKSKLEAEKRRENVPRAPRAAPQRAEQVKDRNTVVISKDYLDQLLRMSVMAGTDSTPQPRQPVAAHVTLDHSQLPGYNDKVESHTHYEIPVAITPVTAALSTTTPHQPPPCDSVATTLSPPAKQPQSSSPRGRGLAHEQWLAGLALQAEEQRKKKVAERQQRQQEVPEEYNPWGRPGGGAPVQPPPTQPPADYLTPRAEKKVKETHCPPVNPSHHPSPPPTTLPSHMDHTPQFARGAGPHVDQYVLQQREQQRRKDQEHMEFVRLQIAEKERRQAEERAKKEREDREEEARLAAERAHLQREHQWEAERQRRNEEEAATRRALLQQRIAEAEDGARRAREEAHKGRGKQPWLSAAGELGGQFVESTPKHTVSTVRFQEPEDWKVSRMVPQRSSQLLLPQHDDDLCSPSMQVLAELASPRHAGMQKDRQDGGHKDTAHTHSGHSLLSKKQQKGGENREGKWRSEQRNPLASQSKTALKDGGGRGQRGARRGPHNGASKNQKTATTQEPPSRSSKIPVRRAANSGRGPHSGRGSHTDSNPHKCSPAKEPATAQHKARSCSPPVPALAHKLKFPGNASSYQPQLQPSASTLRNSSPPVPALARQLAQKKNPARTNLGKSVSFHSNAGSTPEQPYRSDSPPVPALANRLQAYSPPVPALANRLQAHSPPLPALANKLQAERPHSPPLPALANRLHMDTCPHDRNLTQKSNATHPLADDGVYFSINRPPSCVPINSPLEASHLATLPTLPTGVIPHIPSAYHALRPSTTGQNRQEKLLQELAALRKGLISQKSDLDERVKQILSRNACVL